MNSPGSGIVVVVVVVVGGTVVVVVVVGGGVVVVVVVGGRVVVVVVVGGGRVVVVVVVLDVVVVVGGTVVVVELVAVGGEIEVGGIVGRSVVEVVDGGAAATRPGVAAFDGSVGVVTAAVVVPAGEAPLCFPVAVIELEDAVKAAGAIGGELAVETTSLCDDATPSGELDVAHVSPTIRATTGISTTMARNASALSRSG